MSPDMSSSLRAKKDARYKAEIAQLRHAYAQLWRETRPTQLGIIWKPLHIALRFRGHWHTLLSFAW